MLYIEPLTRYSWSDEDEDFQDTCEVFGYQVRDERGAVLGSGETREAALAAAQEAVLLPTCRLPRHA
ncbi:MAG TPA: hypothetical protein VEB18_02055 [Candidatus Paceibacterota bacterium]|nr:hypothetical protein [Candidatus Paceibacterota bacterium]